MGKGGKEAFPRGGTGAISPTYMPAKENLRPMNVREEEKEDVPLGFERGKNLGKGRGSHATINLSGKRKRKTSKRRVFLPPGRMPLHSVPGGGKKKKRLGGKKKKKANAFVAFRKGEGPCPGKSEKEGVKTKKRGGESSAPAPDEGRRRRMSSLSRKKRNRSWGGGGEKEQRKEAKNSKTS